jgi:hypothetical protein
VITAQPTDQSVLTGATGTFSVTATGSGLSYQWYVSVGNASPTLIVGQTSSSYTAPAATWQSDGTRYSVKVKNAGGTVTSNAATLHLAPSADQQAFESFSLGNRSYEFDDNLVWAPTAQQSGIDYLAADYSTVASSPLTNGPQSVQQSALVNLTHTLALPNEAPSYYIKGGTIHRRSATGYVAQVGYNGSKVQVDEYADDNVAVYSVVRSNYQVVDVSGLPVTNAPTALAYAYGLVFQNAGMMSPSAVFANGAKFESFDSLQSGARYQATDCPLNTVSFGALPAACPTSATTLEAMLAGGWHSSSDGATYTLTNGTISTNEGIRMYIADAPRPVSAAGAVQQYRMYFEYLGKMYTGHVIKDGTPLGAGVHRSDPTDASTAGYVTYSVRVNQALIDSLTAASLY